MNTIDVQRDELKDNLEDLFEAAPHVAVELIYYLNDLRLAHGLPIPHGPVSGLWVRNHEAGGGWCRWRDDAHHLDGAAFVRA